MRSAGFSLVVATYAIGLASALPPGKIDGTNNIHQLDVVRKAFAKIQPSGAEDLDAVSGQIRLEETEQGVFITGEIKGLKPGCHGFHVHQEGKLEDYCKAAGGHFNPEEVSVTTNIIIAKIVLISDPQSQSCAKNITWE